jgi:hypothetical protein
MIHDAWHMSTFENISKEDDALYQRTGYFQLSMNESIMIHKWYGNQIMTQWKHTDWSQKGKRQHMSWFHGERKKYIKKR